VEAVTDEPRQPPHDLGAEQAALGAMLLSRDVLLEVSEIVTPASFYRPAHALIFEAILELDMQGEPADAYTVATALAAKNALGKIPNGAGYLHDLIAAVPTAANGAYYARTVAARALSRQLQAAAVRIGQIAASDTDPLGALERAMQLLADLELEATPATGGPRAWGEIASDVMDAIEEAGQVDPNETPGIGTGFSDLDKLLNGLVPGQVIVVGARPGVGKSVLLANIAQQASWRKKLPAVFFSLEMSAVELGTRLVSSAARVPLNILNTGKLTDQDWAQVAHVIGESAEAPLFIDDTAELTIGEIRSRARKLQRQHGELALIVVDYMQLVGSARSENRQLAVANISRGLKLLAKQMRVPVLVASQLNRGPEGRSSKVPQMSDLRESGAIEADADVVILVHREDYHDPESSRAGEADFIVAKNRRGPKDTVTVAAQLHLARFVDMAMP
jgi:replicative DNA helicase